MKKEKDEPQEHQSELRLEEENLKNLIKIVKSKGGKVYASQSDTHFKDDPSCSFSLRFNDTVSIQEEEGVTTVSWTKNEYFPLKEQNRQTETLVVIKEHTEKIMMKFNYKHKNGPEPYIYHEIPQLNWWVILSLLNETIEDSIRTN